MWKKVLEFCAWVLSKAWRWGWSRAKKIVAWAKNNYRTVYKWIERGVSYGTIVEFILRILGLG